MVVYAALMLTPDDIYSATAHNPVHKSLAIQMNAAMNQHSSQLFMLVHSHARRRERWPSKFTWEWIDCLDEQPSCFIRQLQQPHVNHQISQYTNELKVFSESLAVQCVGEVDRWTYGQPGHLIHGWTVELGEGNSNLYDVSPISSSRSWPSRC